MTAVHTALDAWIEAHPFDPDSAARAAEAAEQDRQAWLRGDAVGAYCVSRSTFELLHALEGSAPLRDVEVDLAAAARLRRRLTATVHAWLAADRDYAAGRRASPAFAILEFADLVTSLDSGQIFSTRRPPPEPQP